METISIIFGSFVAVILSWIVISALITGKNADGTPWYDPNKDMDNDNDDDD